MNYSYIIKCARCGRVLSTNEPCKDEMVICAHCSLRAHMELLGEAGIEGSEAGIALRNQMDKLFMRIEDDKMLDKILKQAIKEDNFKMWCQRIADYIKKFINILRL